LTVDELENYEGLKDFILSVSKLTPREYKARCDNATKRHDESFVYFAARLQNNFGYYLRSHEVNHDFNCLCDLLLADHLKTALPSAPLNYVLSLQGGDWFDPKRVSWWFTAPSLYISPPSSTTVRSIQCARSMEKLTENAVESHIAVVENTKTTPSGNFHIFLH